MVDFHPKSQMKPITVRQAFKGVLDDGTGDRIDINSKTWKMMQTVKPGNTHPKHQSYYRLHYDHPSITITVADGAGHYMLWHPAEHRLITLNECKRLASFPDTFQFTGGIRESWKRMGNSVPPRFMQAIATNIYETILAPLKEREE